MQRTLKSNGKWLLGTGEEGGRFPQRRLVGSKLRQAPAAHNREETGYGNLGHCFVDLAEGVPVCADEGRLPAWKTRIRITWVSPRTLTERLLLPERNPLQLPFAHVARDDSLQISNAGPSQADL